MQTSSLAHLYELDRIAGDPSKRTLEDIIEEFTLDMVATSNNISYAEARTRVEKTVLAMVEEKRIKDLASMAIGNPGVKLNRHQRRKQEALRRKHSTRNKS